MQNDPSFKIEEVTDVHGGPQIQVTKEFSIRDGFVCKFHDVYANGSED